MVCVSSRAIVSNSFISVALRRVKCAKHCAIDFGDFGVLQHLLNTTTRCSQGVRSTGGDLLDCCAADCLGICSAATMTCANGSTELSWLVGWFLGRGPELVLTYHVRVARVPVVHWLVKLLRPPTASPVKLGTGVLWVSTGTHPCGPPPRQDGGGTRAPALHTLDDMLRFRGDMDYRAVLLYATNKKRRKKEEKKKQQKEEKRKNGEKKKEKRRKQKGKQKGKKERKKERKKREKNRKNREKCEKNINNTHVPVHSTIRTPSVHLCCVSFNTAQP